MPIPISLAETNEALLALRIGSKASLVDCLTSDVQCPASIKVQGNSCLLIDGQAMVIAIGKPQTCKTFGDFANACVNRVISVSAAYDKVDIVFDRYRDNSIMESSCQRRTKTAKRIRRVIESLDVPLPFDWNNFTLCNSTI